MKLNCGPTKEERKQLKRKKAEDYIKKLWNEGEVVFAIFPRRVGPNDCRWLEPVRRKLDRKRYSSLGDAIWSITIPPSYATHLVYEAVDNGTKE